jgi:NADH:ubiquinone oxidoreductase subunit 5 (subunit L)/multisubunit Na+/H+ antiporter MnhA subunit
MKITPLLRYPPPLQLGITVTVSLCITAAHCRQSKDFSNDPRILNILQAMGNTQHSIGATGTFLWRIIDWLSDWLTGWLTDWLTGWLAGWLSDWLTDWLTDWMTDWLTDWLGDWLSDWLTDWLADWLAAWLADRLTDWLTDWLIGWLADWLSDWLSGWLTDYKMKTIIHGSTSYTQAHHFEYRHHQFHTKIHVCTRLNSADTEWGQVTSSC